MKILIAYDGSDYANAAIEDLSRAGLPEDTGAIVLTVTETWLPSPHDTYIREDPDDPDWLWRNKASAKVAECEQITADASRKIKEIFPGWQVEPKVSGGFPEWAVVAEADKLKPDLIVVGSQGRNAVGRFVLGSVSLKVLSEAACSVRVARHSSAETADENSPQRIIIGIDGSPDSHSAVEAVADRVWLPKSEVRLMTIIEKEVNSVHQDYPKLENKVKKAEELQKNAADRLKQSGLRVSTVVRAGRAKNDLVEEAEKWNADCIFLGAKGHRFLERILLGSVSYSVAARAHCSVEVVRKQN